jgi:hypothetical protein
MWESVQFRIDEVQSKVDSHSGTLESQKEMIGLAIQEVEKLIKEQTREELRV